MKWEQTVNLQNFVGKERLKIEELIPETLWIVYDYNPDESGWAWIDFAFYEFTYQEMNARSNAFTEAFNALGILTKNVKDPMYKYETAVACYSNLGYILELQEKPSEAVPYYAQALKIQQKYLPTNHPDLIDLEHTIQSLSAKPSDSS